MSVFNFINKKPGGTVIKNNGTVSIDQPVVGILYSCKTSSLPKSAATNQFYYDQVTGKKYVGQGSGRPLKEIIGDTVTSEGGATVDLSGYISKIDFEKTVTEIRAEIPSVGDLVEKNELDNAIQSKADKADVYTKSESDAAFAAVNHTHDNIYTKQETDAQISAEIAKAKIEGGDSGVDLSAFMKTVDAENKFLKKEDAITTSTVQSIIDNSGHLTDADIADMLTKTGADTIYQPIGDYATKSQLDDYVKTVDLPVNDFTKNLADTLYADKNHVHTEYASAADIATITTNVNTLSSDMEQVKADITQARADAATAAYEAAAAKATANSASAAANAASTAANEAASTANAAKQSAENAANAAAANSAAITTIQNTISNFLNEAQIKALINEAIANIGSGSGSGNTGGGSSEGGTETPPVTPTPTPPEPGSTTEYTGLIPADNDFKINTRKYLNLDYTDEDIEEKRLKFYIMPDDNTALGVAVAKRFPEGMWVPIETIDSEEEIAAYEKALKEMNEGNPGHIEGYDGELDTIYMTSKLATAHYTMKAVKIAAS